MSVAGKIFPELWVDCFRCRTAVACGESKHDAAVRSALNMGWKKITKGWVCPQCQKL